MFSPGLLDGNPPPRWGAPGEDQIGTHNAADKRGTPIPLVMPFVGIAWIVVPITGRNYLHVYLFT